MGGGVCTRGGMVGGSFRAPKGQDKPPVKPKKGEASSELLVSGWEGGNYWTITT